MALQRLGGVFLNKTKKGESYFGFTLDGNRYAIFKNNKAGENGPPYSLVRFTEEAQAAAPAAPATRKVTLGASVSTGRQMTSRTANVPAPVQPVDVEADDDVIPF